MKTIICLSGKKGSGKSLVSDILLELLNCYVTVYSMATILKKVVSTITQCNIKKLEDQNYKNSLSPYIINQFGIDKMLTYRECMLHFGKLLRYDNDKIFINDALNTITNSIFDIFIIPDVREIQEVKSIKEYAKSNNIRLIHIQILRNVKSDNTFNDKTETDLDSYHDYDYTINNNKITKTELCENIKIMLEYFKIDNVKPFIPQKLF